MSKRVLIVHPWGLGDLIMATPMMKSLKMGGYTVDLVIMSNNFKTVLKNSDFLNEIYVVDNYLNFRKFFRRYDYLVATAGVNPLKIKLLNVLIMAKKVFATSQKKDIHRVDLNLKMVEKLTQKITKEPYIFVNKDLDVTQFIKKGTNIGFAVGSGAKQSFKRWKGFKELIKRLESSANILLFIGDDEKELEREYKELNIQIVKESLEKVIKIISKLNLLVGNDNGLMHIGYGVGINTITIFGMTNEKETGGYRDNNEAVFIENLSCRPCFNPSNDKIGCFSLECLKDISVEVVFSKCQKYL